MEPSCTVAACFFALATLSTFRRVSSGILMVTGQEIELIITTFCRFCSFFQPLILCCMEVLSELLGHVKKFILNHAESIILIKAFIH